MPSGGACRLSIAVYIVALFCVTVTADCSGCNSSEYCSNNDCLTIDNCEPGQFETQAPTGTSNRECETCPIGSYCPATGSSFDAIACPSPEQSTSPVGSDDVDQCICTNEFFDAESTVPGPQCQAWRDPCPETQYASQQPSHTQDRVCSLCPTGSYCPGTPSDPDIVPCPDNSNTGSVTGASSVDACVCVENYFDSIAGNGVECDDWTPCEPGTHQTAAPSPTSQRECSACPVNHYCTGVSPFQPLVCPPSTTTNGQLSVESIQGCRCSGNNYDQDPGDGVDCKSHSTCDAGTYETASPTDARDRECSQCPAGSYCPGGPPFAKLKCPNNAESSAGAKTINECTCKSGFWDTAPATTAVTCQAWHTCDPGEFEHSAPSHNSDRECRPCLAGSYCPGTAGDDYPIVSCPTGSSSPVSSDAESDCICQGSQFDSDQGAGVTCSSWNDCPFGHYETDAPTALADRVCQACDLGHFCIDNNKFPCGSANKYAGATGLDECDTVSSGHFSVGQSASTRTGQQQCTAGWRCNSGIRQRCNAATNGEYQDETRQTQCKLCSTSCPPGTNVDTACTNTADRTCIDDIPPVISPPAGVRLQAAVDVYVQQQGVVTDSYDGGIPWSRVTISHTIDTSIVGTYEVNYSVRDAAGNIGRAVRTVEVYDEIAPFLSLRGDDYVLLEAGVDDTWQDPGAIAQDAVDGDLEDQIEVTGLAEVLQLLTDKAEGTVSMTYNVKDFSDNEASQVVRTVEVADLTNPIIVLNGLATVYVEATPLKQPYIDQGATAIDAVDPDIDVHISGEALVDSSIPGSYTIRFTATSSNSQPADPVERTVIVRDSTVPTLSLFGDAPVMLLEGGLQYDEPGAQAEDTFCPNEGLQVVITGADVIDSLAPVGTEYEVVYNVQDCSGLDAVTVVRTVRIVDTLRPVISANRPNNLTLYHEAGTPYADPGATALDKHDGVVTVLPLPEHVPVNTAPKDTPAVFEFNYTAVDGVGLQATPVTRTVIVRDTLAPTITLQGPLSLVHEAATDFDDPGFNASDVLDTIVVVTSNATADMVRPPSTPFDVVLEYTAQDKAGNRAVPVYRRVTVDDTTPPDVDLNGPANVIHEGALAYSDLGATSTDMLDGNLTRFVARDVFLVHESADGSPAVLVPVADVDPMLPSGTVFHVNYSVSDQAGNVESALRTVTLDDSTLPRIWLQVDPVVYVEGRSPRVSFDDVGVWPGATANDTLDLELTDTMVAVVRGPSVTGGMEVIDTSAPLGTEFEVTYSVSDAAGNAAQPVSRKVVVVDTVPPVISLVPDTNSTGTDPSRIVLVAQQPYFDAGAEAFDDYGGDVTGLVTVVGKDAIDNTVVGVSFNLTYLCNDTAGNAAMPVHRSVTFVQPKSSSSASSIATFAAAGGAPIFIILLVVLAVVFVRHRRRTNRGVGHGIKSSGSFVLPTVNGGVTDMTVMADCWTAGPAQFGSGEVAASTFQTDGGVFSVPMVEPTDAMTSPWFHGPIAREVAEERIRDAPGVQEGSFLVRQKGEEGTSFAISMMTSQRVMHYILKLTTEGVFVLWNKQVSKPCKASLAGSVEHLKTNRECLPSALTVGIDRPATSTEIGCRNSDTSTDMDVEEKEYSLLTVHRDDIPADTGLFVRAVSNGQVCFVQVDSCMPLPTVPLFVEMAGSGSKSSSLVQETSMYDLPDRQVHLYAQAVGPQGPVHVPIVTRTPLPEVPLFTIINSGSADQLFLPYDRPEEPPAQHHRGAAVLTLDGSGTLAADSSDADLDQYDSVDNALPNRRESLLLQHQQQDMYEVTLPSAAAAAAPSTAASPTTASPLPAALHTWFHGPITRKQASSRLAAAGGQDGVFLVRSKADKPHQYVVSLMFDGECVHFVLEHHQPPADGGGDGGGHGGFVLQGEPLDAAWASDLASVVEHLQQQAEGELPCALGAVTDNPHGPQPLPAAAQARNGATPPDTGNATPAVSVDTPDMYAPLTQDIEQLLQSAGVSHADDGTYAPITQDIGRLLAESGVELFVRDGASQDFSAAKEELLVGSEQLYAKFGSEPGGSGAGEATASAVADADADADAARSSETCAAAAGFHPSALLKDDVLLSMAFDSRAVDSRLTFALLFAFRDQDTAAEAILARSGSSAQVLYLKQYLLALKLYMQLPGIAEHAAKQTRPFPYLFPCGKLIDFVAEQLPDVSSQSSLEASFRSVCNALELRHQLAELGRDADVTRFFKSKSFRESTIISLMESARKKCLWLAFQLAREHNVPLYKLCLRHVVWLFGPSSGVAGANAWDHLNEQGCVEPLQASPADEAQRAFQAAFELLPGTEHRGLEALCRCMATVDAEFQPPKSSLSAYAGILQLLSTAHAGCDFKALLAGDWRGQLLPSLTATSVLPWQHYIGVLESGTSSETLTFAEVALAFIERAMHGIVVPVGIDVYNQDTATHAAVTAVIDDVVSLFGHVKLTDLEQLMYRHAVRSSQRDPLPVGLRLRLLDGAVNAAALAGGADAAGDDGAEVLRRVSFLNEHVLGLCSSVGAQLQALGLLAMLDESFGQGLELNDRLGARLLLAGQGTAAVDAFVALREASGQEFGLVAETSDALTRQVVSGLVESLVGGDVSSLVAEGLGEGDSQSRERVLSTLERLIAGLGEQGDAREAAETVLREACDNVNHPVDVRVALKGLLGDTDNGDADALAPVPAHVLFSVQKRVVEAWGVEVAEEDLRGDEARVELLRRLLPDVCVSRTRVELFSDLLVELLSAPSAADADADSVALPAGCSEPLWLEFHRAVGAEGVPDEVLALLPWLGSGQPSEQWPRNAVGDAPKQRHALTEADELALLHELCKTVVVADEEGGAGTGTEAEAAATDAGSPSSATLVRPTVGAAFGLCSRFASVRDKATEVLCCAPMQAAPSLLCVGCGHLALAHGLAARLGGTTHFGVVLQAVARGPQHAESLARALLASGRWPDAGAVLATGRSLHTTFQTIGAALALTTALPEQ
eukprot:m.399001 g.399001  ORF g.399001 m.399001 type:complete len:2967 (-) comp20111_c4_seq14:113-9013(-)